MATTGSLPSRVAVTGTGHVVTGGVVETIAHLTTAITIGTRRAFLEAEMEGQLHLYTEKHME